MLTCVPSYGRDYKTEADVRKAWSEGKDFTINDMSSPDDGRQINKEDADRAKVTVKLRFAKKTKAVIIKPA